MGRGRREARGEKREQGGGLECGGEGFGARMAAMEPEFRFCASADGTRIAYAVYGSGPPLLYLQTPFVSMDARFALPVMSLRRVQEIGVPT